MKISSKERNYLFHVIFQRAFCKVYSINRHLEQRSADEQDLARCEKVRTVNSKTKLTGSSIKTKAGTRYPHNK